MGTRWRKRRPAAASAGQEAQALERAQHALEQARAQHETQARMREQEQESLIARMEHLAEGNHLAALVWDVVAGNGGRR